MKVLKDNEIQSILKDFGGWEFADNQIGKEFELKDFKTALRFVNNVGEEAEKMDHHPDIFLHSWNKVKITIATHSAGGVTENDFKLASKIEKIDK